MGWILKGSSWVISKEHEIKITPEWLLGFVEGGWSFSVDPKKFFFSFISVITQKNEQKLMNAIKRLFY